MRDRVFSGRDVAEAVRAASLALGIPEAALKVVVLDAGAPAGPAASATPARIAVLLSAPGHGPEEEPRPEPPGDAKVAIRRVVAAIAEEAGLVVDVAFEESAEALLVRLGGPGRELLLEEGGQVLLALEHLLQRMYGRTLEPRRLLVNCDGYREARDAWLTGRAQELADIVKRERAPQETEPLNAYDRRIIHMALSEVPGVRTFSVGQGADRRVTVALAEPR